MNELGTWIVALAGYGIAVLALLGAIVQAVPPYKKWDAFNAVLWLAIAFCAAALTKAVL